MALWVLALAVMVLAVRVTVAPLTIPFGGHIAERIKANAAVAVQVDAVAVQITGAGAHLVLRDVALSGEGARVRVPAVRLVQGLSGRSLVLDRPDVRVDPSGGGPLALPLPADALRALDSALTALWRQVHDQGFERLAVGDGRLEAIAAGRPIDEARVFRNVNASVALGRAGRLNASLDFIGAEGRVAVSALRAPQEGSESADAARQAGPAEGRRLVVNARGVSPRDLGRAKPVVDGFLLAPRLEVEWAADGTPQRAGLELTVGEGTVRFAQDPQRTLDGATIELAWQGPGEPIVVADATFVAGPTRLAFEGTVVPVGSGPWSFALTALEAVFDPPDIEGPPQIVDHFTITGRLDAAQRALIVDRLAGAMTDGRVDASFTMAVTDEGPTLSGAANVSAGLIPALMATWPPVLAHGPRVAVLNTVRGGVLTGVTADFALTPLELDGRPDTHDMVEGGLSLDAGFVGGTLAAEDLPVSITRAKGTLSIRDKALSATVTEGVIDAGEGGMLRVIRGTVEIPHMERAPPQARASLVVEGPLSAVVSLAAAFDVTEMSGTAITTEDVSGRVRATVAITTPLGPDVPMSQRSWSIEARLFNASSKIPIGGQTVERANVQVAINKRRLAARGRAVIDGLTVDVNYSELFAGKRTGAARVVLTDKDRRDRGFDTGNAVRGPVVLTIEAGDGDANVILADLTEAAIAVPGFEKIAGTPLTAEAVVEGEGKTVDVRDIRVEGDGIAVEGRLALQDGALANADFSRIVLTEGDDVEVSVDQRDGVYRVAATAKRFDARPLMTFDGGDSDTSSGNGGSGPPLSVEVTADRVRVADTSVVTDLALTAAQSGGSLRRLTASGRLDGQNDGAFALTVAPEGEGRRSLRGEIASLGRVLDTFGIYDHLDGGQVMVEGSLDGDGVLVGRARARAFKVRNERTLDDLITRAQTHVEPTSRLERGAGPLALQQAGGQTEDGIPFDELVVDFERRGSTIVVREAILRGPIMGGTAEGVVDLNAKEVRLNGTFIPAYGVNNLFGRLPLFGEILGAGEKGGLIGVTFRLSGPLDSPVLTVNPISAIAPGIFRRIFEFR